MPESTAGYFDYEAFARACDRSGLSRKRIAEALGVTPTTVSSLAGGRSSPQFTRLARIAEVLGGEPSDYLKLPPRSEWKLEQYRVAHGYTQGELARKLRVAPSLVSSWERDKGVPSEAMAQRLAELYGVAVSVIRPEAPPTQSVAKRTSAASSAMALDLAESVLAYAQDAAGIAARVSPAERVAIHAQIRDRVEQSIALLGSLIAQLPPVRRVAAYRLLKRLIEVFDAVSDTE